MASERRFGSWSDFAKKLLRMKQRMSSGTLCAEAGAAMARLSRPAAKILSFMRPPKTARDGPRQAPLSDDQHPCHSNRPLNRIGRSGLRPAPLGPALFREGAGAFLRVEARIRHRWLPASSRDAARQAAIATPGNHPGENGDNNGWHLATKCLGSAAIRGEPAMFVKLTSVDRVITAINAAQVTFISPVTDGTRIRFGEGRSVTVVEPLEEVIDKLSRSERALVD